MEITFNSLPEAMEKALERLAAIEKLLTDQQKDPDPGPDGYITRTQVCKLLHITLPTVHSWMKQGKLKAYHVGGRTLFRESEVLESVKPVDYSIK